MKTGTLALMGLTLPKAFGQSSMTLDEQIAANQAWREKDSKRKWEVSDTKEMPHDPYPVEHLSREELEERYNETTRSLGYSVYMDFYMSSVENRPDPSFPVTSGMREFYIKSILIGTVEDLVAHQKTEGFRKWIGRKTFKL